MCLLRSIPHENTDYARYHASDKRKVFFDELLSKPIPEVITKKSLHQVPDLSVS